MGVGASAHTHQRGDVVEVGRNFGNNPTEPYTRYSKHIFICDAPTNSDKCIVKDIEDGFTGMVWKNAVRSPKIADKKEVKPVELDGFSVYEGETVEAEYKGEWFPATLFRGDLDNSNRDFYQGLRVEANVNGKWYSGKTGFMYAGGMEFNIYFDNAPESDGCCYYPDLNKASGACRNCHDAYKTSVREIDGTPMTRNFPVSRMRHVPLPVRCGVIFHRLPKSAENTEIISRNQQLRELRLREAELLKAGNKGDRWNATGPNAAELMEVLNQIVREGDELFGDLMDWMRKCHGVPAAQIRPAGQGKALGVMHPKDHAIRPRFHRNCTSELHRVL